MNTENLKGFNYPLTPKGKSTLNPTPPWYYSSDFLDIEFWAAKDDGLPRNKLEATASLMKKIGAIKPDKEPVTFDNLVDASIWKDANAMVK